MMNIRLTLRFIHKLRYISSTKSKIGRWVQQKGAYMNDRPVLDRNLDSKTFRGYYYLKEELVNFCRENGIPASGGKIEITGRIAYFLDTGKILSAPMTRKKQQKYLTLAKIQKLKQTLYVRKNIEHFSENILEVVFHSMWLFKNG